MEYASRYDWDDASIPALAVTTRRLPPHLPRPEPKGGLQEEPELSRARRRTRTTWKGEALQRRLRTGPYFELCGQMTDKAKGVDLAVSELRNLIEHVQWSIKGDRRLPLPKNPYRKVSHTLIHGEFMVNAYCPDLDGFVWQSNRALGGLGAGGR